MKLYIASINSYIMTQFLLSDPKLIAMSMSDDALKDLDKGLGFSTNSKTILGVYTEEKELICCYLVSLFTNETLELHMYLATKYHHSGVARKAFFTLIKYFKEHTTYTGIFTMAPTMCTHIGPTVLSWGFKFIGILPKAMIWREKLQDLNIYIKEIKR